MATHTDHTLEDRTRAAQQRLITENPAEGTTRYIVLRSDYLLARIQEFRHLAKTSDPRPAAEFRQAADEAQREYEHLLHEAAKAWAGIE